jgi:hypothetical protein
MKPRPIHECSCAECQAGNPLTQVEHSQLNLIMSRLDEQQRRWLAGVEANRLGYGGTEQVHRITGLDINTIRRGRGELAKGLAGRPAERIRVSGGGRKRLEKK